MTDHELLELAAKAAGLKLLWTDEDQPRVAESLSGYINYEPWDPLADDGDALRLAVRLKLNIVHLLPKGVEAISIEYKERSGYVSDADHDNDHEAATRRAVVRAAAEIGKGMP